MMNLSVAFSAKSGNLKTVFKVGVKVTNAVIVVDQILMSLFIFYSIIVYSIKKLIFFIFTFFVSRLDDLLNDISHRQSINNQN